MPSLTDFTASQGNQFLLDVSLKAAAILAAAWGACLILSLCRSSAASRHMVWSLALASVLGLPFLLATLPPWNISVPWQTSTTLSSQIPPVESDLSVGPLAWTEMPEARSEPMTEPRFEGPVAEAAPQESATSEVSRRDLPRTAGWAWMYWGWLIGALLALSPTCLGLASLWSLRRRSRPVTSGLLFDALQEMIKQLGLKYTVRLWQSPARSMPMTWGLGPATILLPAGAERWSGDRLRVVLLHELAHVQRRDCLTQLLAQIARAVYWFNPMAWLAAHRLRIEQEQACDDLVLSRGFKPSSYAEHLLEVLAGVRSPACVSALASAMARATIERRLVSILDPRQNRGPVSRGRMRLMTVACLALVSTLTVLRFESAEGKEPNGQSGSEQAAAADQTPQRAQALANLRARIAEQYVNAVDEAEVDRGAIRGMLGALRDPHSDYLTPETLAELEKQLGGARVGIGAQLEVHERQIRVVTPLQDSPALAAGVQAGDLILQIDGQPAGSDLTEAVKRIVGTPGSVVRLTIGRDAGQEVEIQVTRGPIKVPTVKGFRRGADRHWEFLLDAKDKIGYIQIAQFGSATAGDVREAVESLKKQGLRGLILDLRFCPGGSLDAAVGVSKLFLSGGTIVSLHSRGQAPVTIAADASGALGDFPLVVLVNGQTASAAEVVAGALQDNQRAVVLGTRTHGKGSVQTLIKLDEGSGAIKLTTSQYRLPSGRNIDRRGQENSWGIDPNEGYFLTVDRAQTKTLLQRRQEREIIGRKSGEPAGQNMEITPKWLEEQQADPQLAAALTTMSARLATGEFAKVSKLGPQEIAQFLKREDVQQRRESVLQNLEQLNRELADLEKESPDNK